MQVAATAVSALAGQTLNLLRVGGYQVTLDFDRSQVQYEQALDVGPEGPALPSSLPGLALLLPLLHREVTAASVEGRGRLVLTFGDTNLGCSPHHAYEAWNYRGDGGTVIVCQPGGGLAIWSGG